MEASQLSHTGNAICPSPLTTHACVGKVLDPNISQPDITWPDNTKPCFEILPACALQTKAGVQDPHSQTTELSHQPIRWNLMSRHWCLYLSLSQFSKSNPWKLNGFFVFSFQYFRNLEILVQKIVFNSLFTMRSEVLDLETKIINHAAYSSSWVSRWNSKTNLF